MTNLRIRNLSSGLVLRHATSEDADALAAFNGHVHSEGDEWSAIGVAAWTLDMFDGNGPTTNAGDFTIVEDTHTGKIVSSCCLISQTWSYEGIPFKVGLPELIGTHPDYRRRGLIREQFNILHQWSKTRGELVQAIGGIPYYYRQFGYEMALNLHGGRSGYKINLPELKTGEHEPYSFRQASENDIPFLIETYNRGCRRSMVHSIWNKDQWHYELTGMREHNLERRDIYIITGAHGHPAGFVAIPSIKWLDNSVVTVYELAPGYAWSAVTPSVARFLWQKGEDLAKTQKLPQKRFGFALGDAHPAYDVFASSLPQVQKPYAFYIRVPDLQAFLQKITPVLEMRLIDTPFDHHSGEIKLSFYHNGIKLVFNKGKLVKLTTLTPDLLNDATASFPDLTFLQLLFGFRNMDELESAFIDCSTKNIESKNLFNTLFPKKVSRVWVLS